VANKGDFEMDILIWLGAAISASGLLGIIYSIVKVRQARNENLDDDALRARIANVIPINLGALFVSILGLMCVVVGILLL
jgi:hypothetical protein